MEEIAQQFKEELQELLNRYKDKMSTPQIMRIAQPIFTKTIGFKDNPERLERILNNAVQNLQTEQDFKNAWKSEKEIRAKIYKGHCSSQEIAEADCDGDIRHCKNACGKSRRINKTERLKGLGYAWQCVDQMPEHIVDVQDLGEFRCID